MSDKFPECDSCQNQHTDPAICDACEDAGLYEPHDESEDVQTISLDDLRHMIFRSNQKRKAA
jgi:hypothetical protein